MIRKSRKLVVVLVNVMMLMLLSVTASAATSDSFRNGNNYGKYVTVSVDWNLISKPGKQYAKVAISSYNICKTNAEFYVKLTDNRGRGIWGGKVKSGQKLKLGDDYRNYRIYVRALTDKEYGSSAGNFLNIGKCDTWKVTYKSGCTIS